MTDQEQAQPINDYGINIKGLNEIIELNRNRSFAEEVEEVTRLGGLDGLSKLLKTDLQKGASKSEEDLDKRRAVFGSNQKKERPPKSFLRLCWEALEDFTLRILLASAIISLVLGLTVGEHPETEWIDGAAILVAVVLVTLVTAVNDFQKEKQFRQLNAVSEDRKMVTVKRDGELIEINQAFVVAGDIVKASNGMDIPVDGVLISGRDVSADESALTGETEPIKKEPYDRCVERAEAFEKEEGREKATQHAVPSPVLLSGTKIVGGEGWFIVVSVGENSVVGRIMELLQQEAEQTPLQAKLEKIASDVGKLGLVAAVIAVLVLFIRYFIEDDNKEESDVPELMGYFIIGITILVVAIPEGLPLAVTISLAFSIQKMLADQNLVRRMQSCETMGGANSICSDKTGTLTMNKMTLTTIWNGKEMDVERSVPPKNEFNPTVYELLSQAMACNSEPVKSEGKWKGNVTDIALLEFLDRMQEDPEGIRKQFLPEEFSRLTFTSKRKRMSTVLEPVPSSQTGRVIHTKGGAEMILPCCKDYLNHEGNLVPITPDINKEMEQVIEGMANKALRTLVIACKDIGAGEEDSSPKDDKGVAEIEKEGYTCIAILGIRDIVRPEVPDAVQICKKAGIKVRMVTGDNKLTAKAIATECHIIMNDHPDAVMEGVDFMERTGGTICKNCETAECECPRDAKTAEKEKKPIRVDTVKNKEEFRKIVKHLDVLARSRPEDKYTLVLGLIEEGHVVAVTGDGTNDAPALKRADVGFAMGITGTEVAKEAADITLLDDNFTSIVKAVKWGRNIYDNIRRFLQFQLTVNVVAVFVAIVGACTIKQSPLTAVQMLWVNLIMDTFASLALATEPPGEELLTRQPHKRTEYIISKKMMKHILGQSVYQLIVVWALVYGGETFIPEEDGHKFENEDGYTYNGRNYDYDGEPHYKDLIADHGYSRHMTVVFNAFVLMQIFNEVNARKIRDELNIFDRLTKNPLFTGIWIGTIIVQFLMVQFGGRPLNCANDGLSPEQWGICIGFGAGSLPMRLILRYIPEDKCCAAGSQEADAQHHGSGVLNLRRGSSFGSMGFVSKDSQKKSLEMAQKEGPEI